MVECFECKGECCKSIAIQIDPPEDLVAYEDLKWYLYDPGITVYFDSEGDWCVDIPIKCKHLNKKGLCDIYDRRPPTCREYDEKCCEENEGDVLILFEKPEDVDRHIEKLKKEGKLK